MKPEESLIYLLWRHPGHFPFDDVEDVQPILKGAYRSLETCQQAVDIEDPDWQFRTHRYVHTKEWTCLVDRDDEDREDDDDDISEENWAEFTQSFYRIEQVTLL